MKAFNDDNFVLETQVAQDLYHNHAAKMPIIDYHCHRKTNGLSRREGRAIGTIPPAITEQASHSWEAFLMGLL